MPLLEMFEKALSCDKLTLPEQELPGAQGPFGWALSDEDMALVDALDEELHCNGDDPATML